MAKFCLDCWNKLNNTKHKASKYVISKELELCEGCGEMKNVVVCERRGRLLRRLLRRLFRRF